MPCLVNTISKHRHHKPSEQAVVEIAGNVHYLGPWRSKGRQIEYDRPIGERYVSGEVAGRRKRLR